VLRSTADTAGDCAAKDVIASIDKGTLEVDYGLGVLAASTSPGGFHRSKNQPYWNAGGSDQDAITDAEIEHALDVARKAKVPLQLHQVRRRLPDAPKREQLHRMPSDPRHRGFHFPGSDRGRRRLSEYELATSYSARPMARFTERLATTQLIGGWGWDVPHARDDRHQPAQLAVPR
jgi:hypothetical protein